MAAAKAVVWYSIPMPGDNSIPGRDVDKVALAGLGTVYSTRWSEKVGLRGRYAVPCLNWW